VANSKRGRVEEGKEVSWKIVISAPLVGNNRKSKKGEAGIFVEVGRL
jgi:hypothetical protein